MFNTVTDPTKIFLPVYYITYKTCQYFSPQLFVFHVLLPNFPRFFNFHDLGLIPGLSRPRKCELQIPRLSRIRTNPVKIILLTYPRWLWAKNKNAVVPMRGFWVGKRKGYQCSVGQSLTCLIWSVKLAAVGREGWSLSSTSAVMHHHSID